MQGQPGFSQHACKKSGSSEAKSCIKGLSGNAQGDLLDKMMTRVLAKLDATAAAVAAERDKMEQRACGG
ncbi:hypothetical protein AB5I41_28915 [Sphingomonas sp. MMS24-JH45]